KTRNTLVPSLHPFVYSTVLRCLDFFWTSSNGQGNFLPCICSNCMHQNYPYSVIFCLYAFPRKFPTTLCYCENCLSNPRDKICRILYQYLVDRPTIPEICW